MLILACCARPTLGFVGDRVGIVHAYILIDAQTGVLLDSYGANRQAHPASLTKLMTLYLTFQRLKSGRLHLGTHLHVSRHAAAQQPTKLWLRAGSTITVRNAILGITTRSANDAAVVLGEALGGSETRFAAMMNREARLLGMTRTRFYNASGLPDARQWTTARDMATLAVALIHTFPQYYHFFGVRAFRFHAHVIYGHNHLLDLCDGVDGMKTGYVSASGYNVVTSAVRDHRRLVGVVLGGMTAHARDLQMMALMNRGFRLPPAPSLLEAGAKGAPAVRDGVKASLDRVHAAPNRVHAEPDPVHGAARLVETSEKPVVVAGRRNAVIRVGGNFRTQRSVRRVLRGARHSAGLALRHGRSLVVRLRARRYQARFSGLSGDQAADACSALRRKKFTCRILTPLVPSDREVATAAEAVTAQSE